MSGNPITLALERAERGDPGADEALWQLVYGDLKQIAAARLRQLRPGETLQPTALVHEAWVRLGAGDNQNWQNRAHFFGAAARSMRNIIVDEARRKLRLRRNAGQAPQTLGPEVAAPAGADQIDVLQLDEALNALQAEYDRPARVVMLRYFAGLDPAEIAELMQVTRRTVDRDFLFARTWLRRHMNRDDTPTDD
ncbi:MAG: sigma-70 family RNA polymerase sigma factor [Planctomycetes bacterium]|nr:sigma-70 family RNA polymerase sigma factor [Planctomycetota bacterium]